MWQRKQSVFLLLALVVSVVCLCLPVGYYEPNGMGTNLLMCNLWIEDNGVRDYSVWALFALLLLSCPLTLWTLISFKNRVMQSRLCVLSMLLLIGWYAVYVFFAFVHGHEGASFHPAFASCLPVVAIILQAMARKGILSDERLVRSADRIR